MNCIVPYIEKYYRKHEPELADALTYEYVNIRNKLINSKLFRIYGKEILLSSPGTKLLEKQVTLIKNIELGYNGMRLINSVYTKTGYNKKLIINVHPLVKNLRDVIDSKKKVNNIPPVPKIFIQEGNQFFKEGEVYPTLEDALKEDTLEISPDNLPSINISC